MSRLIDADALEPKFVHGRWDDTYVSNSELINAPTIEERKRGEWEQVHNDDNGIDFRCSVCHRYRFHNGEMLRKYKFCPNCGADMRKGEEE